MKDNHLKNKKPCMTGHTAEFKTRRESDRIRIFVLVPFGALLGTLLVISVASICRIQQKHIDTGVSSRLSSAQRLFSNLLDHEAKFMNGQIDFLKADVLLQTAWLKRDREAVLARAQPLFETMRSAYSVTHFYFVEPDKTCFLRVQDPDRYVDKKRLFTLDRVVAEGMAHYGIELGKFGTFTLRVIHPWRIDGALVGYMELGMEIEHLTPKLQEVLDSELFFMIDKKYLTRSKWEAGLEMMGRAGDWDRFAEFALIDSTMGTIPDDLDVCLEEVQDQGDGALFKTASDGRKYRGGCIALQDAGNRRVGSVIVMTDITEASASLLALSMTLIGVAVGLGSVMLTLFYFYIGRIGRMLLDNQNKLGEEVGQRRAIEKKLRHSNSEMEQRIESRTGELAKTNKLLQAEVSGHMRAREKLEETMDQLKRFNDLAVGRELRMVELKAEVNELCCQLDFQQRYLKSGRNESCPEPATDSQSCTESAVESEV